MRYRPVMRRIARSAVLVLGGIGTAAASNAFQDPAPAIARWIEAAERDDAVRDAAVRAVLDAGAKGMTALRDAARATDPADRARRIGIESLIVSVVVGALERADDSGMAFEGQFDVLRELQPYAGRMLMTLVIDTPDWFPNDLRPRALPALRDVFPKGPSADEIAGLRRIALDEELEPQALREAVELALAQWGQRDLLDRRIAELVADAGDGSDTAELYFVGRLAHLLYESRDYAAAARRWQQFVEGMDRLGSEVSATSLYAAACATSRAGRVDGALDLLQRCAERIAAGLLDSRQELTRRMFEQDPDLRQIRPSPRFAAIVDTAFGPPAVEDSGPEERR